MRGAGGDAYACACACGALCSCCCCQLLLPPSSFPPPPAAAAGGPEASRCAADTAEDGCKALDDMEDMEDMEDMDGVAGCVSSSCACVHVLSSAYVYTSQANQVPQGKRIYASTNCLVLPTLTRTAPPSCTAPLKDMTKAEETRGHEENTLAKQQPASSRR